MSPRATSSKGQPVKATAGHARPGRPPRLSREQIVIATAALLRRDAAAPLTMTRVADAVGAAPMALYRHFKDRDELARATVEYIIGGLHTQIPADAPWEEQLRAWIRAVYEHFQPYPQLLPLMASTVSPTYIREYEELVRILNRTGLRGRDLAKALYWINNTMMGHLMTDALRPPRLQAVANMYAELGQLPEQAKVLAPLIAELSDIYDDGFEIFSDLTIASIAQLAAGNSAAPSGRARRLRSRA